MLNRSFAARRPIAGLLCALGVGFGLGLGACGREEAAPAPDGAAGGESPGGPAEGAPAARQADQEYTVRGEIAQLPDPANPAKGLQIHHEEIPSFVNRAGEVSGMAPMTMGFTPAPGVDLSELAIGDKVEFTFDVDWDGSPLFQVTAIEKLAPETELDFTRSGGG